MGDINAIHSVIPTWYLVAPPKLARDAPVLDIVKPLVVSIDPVFRDELDFTGSDNIERFLRDALAVG